MENSALPTPGKPVQECTKNTKDKRSAWDKYQSREKKILKTSFIAGLVFMFLFGMFFLFCVFILKSDTVLYRFSLFAPQARTVSLVGDFNGWEPEDMIFNSKTRLWEKKLVLVKGRIYSYNFIIDDEIWITDPNSLTDIQDGFGGASSLLEI